MVFGENQLFPSLISLSPLSTAHPLVLQHQWVRTSSTCYGTFILAMDRSLGFGSTPSDFLALFGLDFSSAFPHGTGSLSVDYEYLALEDGPPVFRQDFSCPALLFSSSVPHSGFRI